MHETIESCLGYKASKKKKREKQYSWVESNCQSPACPSFLPSLSPRVTMEQTVLGELLDHHEYIETSRDLVLSEIKVTPKTVPQRIVQESRVARALGRVHSRARNVQAIYASEKLGALGKRVEGANVFNVFYEHLARVKRAHEGETALAPPAEALAKKVAVDIYGDESSAGSDSVRGYLMGFAGEEHKGRFLDLVVLHREFLNLVPASSIARFRDGGDGGASTGTISYVEYVSNNFFVTSLETLKRETKASSGFRKYLTALLEYLKGFFERTHPLEHVGVLLRELEKQAAQNAKPVKDTAATTTTTTGALPELDTFSTLADLLKAVDGDALKAMLVQRGMKQGGTVEERGKRLFSVKGVPKDKIPKTLRAKPSKKRRKAGGSNGKPPAVLVEYAMAAVQCFAEKLGKEIRATANFHVQKQTRSYTEIMMDLEDEDRIDSRELQARAMGANDGEKTQGEDAKTLYNPKGVPLGFDGKPIPYWMYKLHGLDKTFQCEICGNAVYTGPKAFEKHFQEGRHSMGMATLGVPNSSHFHGITSIQEVLNLHEKLKLTMCRKTWDAAEEEEFEDSEGNVMTKETYEDLKRQGLL